MSDIRDRNPMTRQGYRWEFREGCNCPNCPWGENCQGKTWPHWVETATQAMEERR